MSLIFVHGRAQEDFAGEQLRQECCSALREGAEEANIGVTLADIEAGCVLPYYGKTLAGYVPGSPYARATTSNEFSRSTHVESNDFIVDFWKDAVVELAPVTKLPNDEMRSSTTTVSSISLSELDEQERAIYNHSGVLAVARILDRRCRRLSEFTIDKTLADVGVYLTNTEAQKAVDSIVSDAIRAASEPRIVVAHSLGAVVAFRVIHSLPEVRIARLITIGAPLGVSAVISRIGLASPSFPRSVDFWTNAYDSRDIVSLQTPVDRRSLFREAYQRKASHRYDVLHLLDVVNPTDNCHGFAGYLSDPVIARTILKGEWC